MPATTAVLRTEGRLFLREPGSLFWVLVFPTVLLCVLGAVPGFREESAELGGRRVVDLYVPVAVLLSAIMSAMVSMPPVLGGYRERGVLRRLRATPVSPASLLLAQVAYHALAVLAGAALVAAVGRLAYDVPLPAAPLAWALVLLLAVGAAMAVGAVVTAVCPTTRAATAVGTVVFFPTMFTAGVWLPVQQMPGALRQVVGLTPMGAAAEALGAAAVGARPELLDLLVTAGWAAVLGVVAVRTFRWG